MQRIRLREFADLEYRDPRPFLVELRKLEVQFLGVAIPDKWRHLRTNALKEEREQRAAAIFCEGMSERLGKKILVAQHEAQDYDFVAHCDEPGLQHFFSGAIEGGRA